MRRHLFTGFFLVVLLFLCGLMHASNAHAATIYANSCSQADVQAAINSASNGDTVIVPDGSCTWASTVTISKAITLKGNGLYSVNANHEDTGTWPLTIALSGNTGIQILGSTGQFVRVTGFHFTGTCPSGVSGGGAVWLKYTNQANWRVDNCRFSLSRGTAVRPEVPWGLVDHIYSYDPNCAMNSMVCVSDNRGSGINGDLALTQPVGFGGPNFVFIEDSTFWKNCSTGAASAGATDAIAGGKFVFRHNYVRNAMVVWHGTETGAPLRGPYAFEVYNNEFYWTILSEKYHAAVFQRGGTALIYNNKATNYKDFWKTWVHRSEEPFGRFGRCDGTQPWDGNYGGSYPPGYPCLDQVGCGRAMSADINYAQPQERSKCYIWNNTRINTGAVSHLDPAYVVQGRDYEMSDDNSARPNNYIHYPYPHPFNIPNGTPEPPANLRIVN